MHLMQLTSAILLALAGTGSARPAGNASLAAYNAVLEASPAVLARGKVFLTKDNSCGKIGAGKSNGWYCDSKREGGGACCSSDGWCGDGPFYCEAGCQKDFGHCDEGVEKPSPPVAKCGPRNKNNHCNNGECCSANGFCGKNKNFCSVGCQDKFGKCDAKPKPAPKPAPKPVPKPVERRCGPANKNQRCLGLDCCSHAGYCGIGIEFCAVPQNCLRAFGRCDSDMFPSGPTTIKDPRPQLGKIEYGKYIEDCKEPGTIALTFDDGPNVYTSELLDMLMDAGAKATFMVGGNNNGRQVDQGEKWPKLLKRMVAEGHQIASHTWSHMHMNSMKSEDRKMDMAKTERAIANIIGKYPTYMRPPYGQCDVKSGCLKDMKDMGYALVTQTLDTLDWKNSGGHVQDSIDTVTDYFDHLGPESHALICQHDTLGASVQELTPVILDLIKEKDFRAVTIGECLGDDSANWYRVPGKGTSWLGIKPTSRQVDLDILEPKEPESEHTEEACEGGHCHNDFHEEGTRGLFWSDSPADALSMPYVTPALADLDLSDNHDGIETNHQSEDVKRDMLPLKAKLPTFLSASNLYTRDDAELAYELEMTHAVDEIAGKLLSPEEIAADEKAKESPEDVKEAEAEAEKCFYESNNFCGKIQHFFTKTGCFKSVEMCYRQCSVANGQDNLLEGCESWAQICNAQTIFCLNCGGKDQPECKSKLFKAHGLE